MFKAGEDLVRCGIRWTRNEPFLASKVQFKDVAAVGKRVASSFSRKVKPKAHGDPSVAETETVAQQMLLGRDQ